MTRATDESPSRSEPGIQTPSSYALDELTSQEVNGILAREPRLILPVGALDQHGPHLPLGTNTFIAGRVAEELSRSEEILRAPALCYGVNVPGSSGFPGTATLRRKTLHRAVNELLASWEDHGVEEFIIVSAHRYEPHLDAMLMALTEESRTTVVDLYAIDIADLLESDPIREHAGEVETSLLLHLDPGRVRRGRIEDAPLDAKEYRKYVRGRMPKALTASKGVAGRPSLASEEKGRRIFERWLSSIRQAVIGSGDAIQEDE